MADYKTMKTAEIREDFLSFFESKGCKRYPSSSLVPSDPSLLLANAGMNQFKEYYQGIKTMKEIGATSCQKCLRTNDIDNIGDSRHLSFFEMLVKSLIYFFFRFFRLAYFFRNKIKNSFNIISTSPKD